MFSFFQNESLTKKLTLATDHYISWSSSMGRVRSGNTNYSSKEFVERGCLWLASFWAGILCAKFNNEEVTNISDPAAGITAFAVVMFALHAVTMYYSPKIQQRIKLSNECKKLAEEIRVMVIKDVDLTDADKNEVIGIVQSCGQQSLATDEESKATETWVYRKKLLANLKLILSIKKELFLQCIPEIKEMLLSVQQPSAQRSNKIDTSNEDDEAFSASSLRA